MYIVNTHPRIVYAAMRVYALTSWRMAAAVPVILLSLGSLGINMVSCMFFVSEVIILMDSYLLLGCLSEAYQLRRGHNFQLQRCYSDK